MEYRLSVIFRCLLVLAVGAGCMAAIAGGIVTTGPLGILIAFFLLCIYAGVVCGSMGNMPAFIMLLSIRDLGCVGMFIWALAVTLLSFIIIPILLSWHVSALLLGLLGASFRVPFLRKVLCVVLAGGLFGGIAVYVNNTINQQAGDTLIDNTTIEEKNVTNRHYIINEHHYHTNDRDKDDSEETNGYTELHRAVLAGDSKEVERLIDAGADVNARDNDGNTPLHLAAREGYVACVRNLMESGKVKKYLTNNQGKTALQLAEEHGNTGCAKVISGYGQEYEDA